MQTERWRQIWHVTLPGIRPTMIVLLILNIGTFMAVGFEKVLLLQNPLTYETSDVISTYLYRVGLEANNFSYAAAIGMFEAIIGLTLILSANSALLSADSASSASPIVVSIASVASGFAAGDV